MAKKTVKPALISLSNKEQRALEYLRQNGSISSNEARDNLGDARLAVTIMGLRRKGFDIPCYRVDMTNRYGESTWYGRYVLNE